jgi:hypothetical protein
MIPVYRHEIEAGIAEQVKNNSTIALVTCPTKVENQTIEAKKDVVSTLGKASSNPFDLFFFDSVLVSTGWNNNDDVFLPAELWQAKATPVNKKINFMHDETDIIGHMINVRAVDRSGELIPFSTNIDEIPIAFDLVSGGLLYKIWDNPDLQARMDKLIAGIDSDEWYVSMECLFPHFDYAIITPDGQHKVIARNEESSYLTKHLRLYGGKGVYQDHKIGRALRNMCFSGKGIVDNPANPRSIILKNEQFSGALASVDIFKTERNMTVENTVSKAEYDSLKAEFEKFKAGAEVVKEKAVAKEIEGYQSKINKLETDLDASKEVATAHENKVKSIETEMAELNGKLTKANDELNKLTKEALKAKRLAMFADIDISSEKAEKLVDRFIDSSEDVFAELVTAMPKKQVVEKKEETKASVEEVLDDAKKEVEKASAGTVISDKEEDKTKETRAKAASWFGGLLTTKANATENKKGDK